MFITINDVVGARGATRFTSKPRVVWLWTIECAAGTRARGGPIRAERAVGLGQSAPARRTRARRLLEWWRGCDLTYVAADEATGMLASLAIIASLATEHWR